MKSQTNIDVTFLQRIPALLLTLALGTVIAISPATAQPVNDQCSGALALATGATLNANTATATATGDPTPGCQSFGAGVWYVFTPSSNGVATISTCGSDFDTVLSVYTGTCGALTGLANGCNDDDGPSCNGLQASLTFPATTGTPYYILVGGALGATGNLVISATFTGASSLTNDACSGATPMTLGTAYNVNTATATVTGDPIPECQLNFGASVWYTFTPSTNGIYTIATCGSDFDTVVSIYTGTCGSLTAIASGCNDDDGPACSGLAASVSFTGTAGTTYYILVGGAVVATGNLVVTATAAGSSSLANDTCSGATPMTLGTTYNSNTATATATDEPVPECQLDFGASVWYTFTPTTNGTYLIATCGSDFDTVLSIYTGTCGLLTPIANGCNDDDGPACSGLTASVSFTGTAGTTYYILVGGAVVSTGNLAITATAAATPGVPVITQQPQSQTVCAGDEVTFTVAASSASEISYQWRLNGGDLEGETGSTLSLFTVTPDLAGVYQVVVGNSQGSVTSSVAALTINTEPSITVEPVSVTVIPGTTAEFNVIASGGNNLSYQWLRDGTPVSGGTTATLLVPNVSAANAGTYTVQISNSCGVAIGGPATLTVVNRAIQLGSTQATPGIMVEVPIRLLTSTNENRILLTVVYDNSLVEVTNVVFSSSISNAALVWTNHVPGQTEVEVHLDDAATFPSGTREIARLQFFVSESVSDPALVLLTQGTPSEIFSPEGESLVFAPGNGSIMISGGTIPAPTMNSGTGLFEDDLQIVVPTGGLASDRALRVLVTNLGVDSRGRPIQVYNASGTTNGVPFLQINGPLAAGLTPITVQYIVLDRVTLPTPTFVVQEVSVAQPPVITGTPIVIPVDQMVIANGAVYLKFPSLPGRQYYIQYSPDAVNWITSEPPLTGNGGWLIWMDNGQPKTSSRPSEESSRFYRAFLVD
jgi:hypothetical protein